MLKVGAILGHKARKDGEIPWIIRKGSKKLKVNYLRSVFSDEGCIYIGSDYNHSYISISRYKHVYLTENQKERIKGIENKMDTRTFPKGHVTKTIPINRLVALLGNQGSIFKSLSSIPKLLLGESRLLNELDIEHRLWTRSFNKTSL